MPHDAYDPGIPGERVYRFPYFPRELTGEPMLSTTPYDMTPRPGILNGRIYDRCVPIPAGVRLHRRPYEYARETRRIDLTLPDVPAIDPETMTERGNE